ncbi:uncharacterized protein LOC111264656 [Varroa jacobsoni]|uniref:N-acetyltransferase domain-containing protein n=1 Tax=Varroa destructor TaxID=109461 RepID=A0A7M7K0Z6_VARDE|nr:uncharacterized protein LOC111249372 [Varroa destructor]XP_022696455.1 uncharacterized protein LOC111264656 [Varroa jacobsoni]
MEGLTLRLLKQDELALIPSFWKESVGVPVELRFIKRWYQLDPEGFRVAVDSKNRILGMATVVRQSDTLYVMGYMGVDKDYRGKGIAKQLLENLVARKPGANYALNASADKLGIYLRRGFKVAEDSYGYAYVGKFTVEPEKKSPPGGLELIQIKMGSSHLADLVAYDKEVAGFQRNVELLQLSDPTAIVLAVKQKGKIVAYGKIQHYLLGGAWLGPLYADDVDIAKYLVEALMRHFESQRCVFLFTILSEQARPIAQALNMMLADKISRCYMKLEAEYLPAHKLQKVYSFDDPGFAFL